MKNKYWLRLGKLVDFGSIETFTEELRKELGDRGVSFNKAKAELIKLHARRIHALKKITEKEYFNE